MLYNTSYIEINKKKRETTAARILHVHLFHKKFGRILDYRYLIIYNLDLFNKMSGERIKDTRIDVGGINKVWFFIYSENAIKNSWTIFLSFASESGLIWPSLAMVSKRARWVVLNYKQA